MSFDKSPTFDLNIDAFDRYMTTNEARALYEFLSNLNLKFIALYAGDTSQALLAMHATRKLSDWLLTRAVADMHRVADEPPDDE